jgi:hypothetical protein
VYLPAPESALLKAKRISPGRGGFILSTAKRVSLAFEVADP